MKKFKDVMIDLETLDIKPSSAVLSIGAVCFDVETGELGPTFYQAVDSDDQLSKGRSFSKSTIEWWKGQSEEAKAVFVDPNRVHMGLALDRLSAFLKQNTTKVNVWGNGSTFDISILESMYYQNGKPLPWLYYNIMDLRTFKRFVANGTQISKIVERSNYHNALDDAIVQAKYVIEMLKCRETTVMEQLKI